MDNGRGSFDMLKQDTVDEMERTRDKRLDKVFRIGEIVGIKDSKFSIVNIDHFTGNMVLKLQPNRS